MDYESRKVEIEIRGLVKNARVKLIRKVYGELLGSVISDGEAASVIIDWFEDDIEIEIVANARVGDLNFGKGDSVRVNGLGKHEGCPETLSLQTVTVYSGLRDKVEGKLKENTVKMTEGEKMVWAAVFARGYNKIHNPPGCVVASDDRYVVFSDEKYEEWEQSIVVNSIEGAGIAVMHMREALPVVKEGWGESDSGDAGSYVTEMLEEMLK